MYKDTIIITIIVIIFWWLQFISAGFMGETPVQCSVEAYKPLRQSCCPFAISSKKKASSVGGVAHPHHA